MWGTFGCQVYANKNLFDSIFDLKLATLEIWNNYSFPLEKNLVKSFPKHALEVIIVQEPTA